MKKQPLLKRRAKQRDGKKTSQLKRLLVGLSIAASVMLINKYLPKTDIMILGIILILALALKTKNPMQIFLIVPLVFLLKIGEIGKANFFNLIPPLAKGIIFLIIYFIMFYAILVLIIMYDFKYFSSTKKIKKDDSFEVVAIAVLDLYREALNTDKPLSLPQSRFLLDFYKKEWGVKEDKFKERIYSLGLLYYEINEENPELLVSREQQSKFNNQVGLLKKELIALL